HPEFTTNHWALAGAYASAIVEAHPGEFVVDTMPLLWTTLAPYYEEHPLDPSGPLARPLTMVDGLFRHVHQTAAVFPWVALLYVALLTRKRTRGLVAVQACGGVILLTAYDLAIIALGANDEYPRLHTPIEPLMLLVVWGTLLLSIYVVYLHGLRLRRQAVH